MVDQRDIFRHPHLLRIEPREQAQLDLATDGAAADLPAPADGRTLVPLLAGDDPEPPRPVVAEYLAEGSVAPMLMVRHGRYKYTAAPGDAPMLFDLVADPRELDNLAGRAEHGAAEASLRVDAEDHWDADAVRTAVVASQRRRRFVNDALQKGRVRSWGSAETQRLVSKISLAGRPIWLVCPM